MRYRILFVSLFCIGLLSSTWAAEKSAYQSGTIVSIQKRSALASSSGTDAQLESNRASYDVVIRTAGTNYNCVYETTGDLNPTWAEGKEGQMRIKGRGIYIKKVNGAEELCSIKSKKKAK